VSVIKRFHKPSAFTYLEILVVIGILIILAYLIGPRLPHRLGDGELRTPRKARLQMREIMKALDLYKDDNGCYPSTRQGLKALVEKPAGSPMPRKWKKYLERVPLDPWGRQYLYECPGGAHGRAGDAERDKSLGTYGYYDLTCLGADGEESDDDVVSWNMPDER
jgi:general secretion pathway protein G